MNNLVPLKLICTEDVAQGIESKTDKSMTIK